MGVTNQWFVDAWAVRDGLAFASYRGRDDIRGAERSVFIAVPNLDAIPVGRASTALWATRANFQDGFVSRETGDEIGFGTLEEVKELVRRGYLAGGIGPGPGAGGEQAPPSPEPVPNAGDALLETGMQELADRQSWFEGSKDIGELVNRVIWFSELSRGPAIDDLFEHLRVFAEASLAKWAEEIRQNPLFRAPIDDFVRWLYTLHACAVWRSPRELDGALERIGTPSFLSELDLWAHRPFLFGAWPVLTALNADEQIIFRVPCPRMPKWHPRIERLSDKLLLATSTIDYFDMNSQLVEFIPSLLAAMATVSHASVQSAHLVPDARRQLLKAALEWLSSQMPQLRLPPDAEYLLTDFAWSELNRH